MNKKYSFNKPIKFYKVYTKTSSNLKTIRSMKIITLHDPSKEDIENFIKNNPSFIEVNEIEFENRRKNIIESNSIMGNIFSIFK